MNWSMKSKTPKDFAVWPSNKRQEWWEQESERLNKLSKIYNCLAIFFVTFSILCALVALGAKFFHIIK